MAGEDAHSGAADGVVPLGRPGDLDSDSAIATELLEFLRDPEYFTVVAALVMVETHRARLQIDGHVNLRDVLDHLVRASQESRSRERWHHLAEAREHLRRAAVNPLQTAVDGRFLRIDKQLGWRYELRTVLFSDVAPMREVRRRKQEADDLLAEARLLKGQPHRTGDAIQLLWKCASALDDLLIDMRPGRRLVFFRCIVGAVLMLVGALVGYEVKSLLGP